MLFKSNAMGKTRFVFFAVFGDRGASIFDRDAEHACNLPWSPLDASSLINGISSRQGSHQLAKKLSTKGLPRKVSNVTDLPSRVCKLNAMAARPTAGPGLGLAC